MEYTLVLVYLGLISVLSVNGAGLLQGDAHDQIFSQSSPVPGRNPTQAPPLGAFVSDYLEDPEKDSYGPLRGKSIYPSRGNIRKSFSLETTPPPTTPHFEALLGRNTSASPRPRTLYINNQRVEDPQDILRQFTSLRRGQNGDYGRSYGVKTYEERLAESAGRGSGPSLQYPERSTENYPIREEDLSSTLGSFSYATPTPNYRGNVRYSTSSEPSSDSSGVVKNWVYDRGSSRRAYIEPTTYRPLFKPTPSPSEYAFSFRTRNHSREEVGNSRGSFRGSIKFADTLGRDKEIQYAASPEIGLVTSEVPYVSVAGRSGQRQIPPSVTPSPYFPSNAPSRYSPSVTPSPYSPSVTPSPYSPSGTPLPYSPSGTPSPYSPSGTPLAYSPNGTPSPYAPRSVTPSPYAPTGGAYSYSFVTNGPDVSPDNELRYGKSYPTTESYLTSRSLPTPDGSYVFSFNAGDHERHETRDRDGRVRGMYSYESPDGERKLVEYEAGAGQGFVAQGRHLPVHESGQLATPSLSDQEEPAASYYFSYDAGDHARQEVRDSDGNVRGYFSFLTGDGRKKTVHYRANPEDGFHIENTHIARADQVN